MKSGSAHCQQADRPKFSSSRDRIDGGFRLMNYDSVDIPHSPERRGSRISCKSTLLRCWRHPPPLATSYVKMRTQTTPCAPALPLPLNVPRVSPGRMAVVHLPSFPLRVGNHPRRHSQPQHRPCFRLCNYISFSEIDIGTSSRPRYFWHLYTL